MKNMKCWKKEKTGFKDRHVWQTKNHQYGIVVHKMAYGGKYFVGYNDISNPNTVDLGIDVTKKKAMTLANKFMKSHDTC